MQKQSILKKAVKSETISTKELLNLGYSRPSVDNVLSDFAKVGFLNRIKPGVYEPTKKTRELFEGVE